MTSAPDIILGVSRAADSVRQREVVSRLERLSQEAAAAPDAGAASADPAAAWSAEVELAAANASRPAPAAPPESAPTGPIAANTTSVSRGGSVKTPDAYVQFEAVLLQNMIEAMLPDDEAVFGSGTAGNIWKSMLAEKVAAEVARTGTIGIAKQLAEGPTASAGAIIRSKVHDA